MSKPTPGPWDRAGIDVGVAGRDDFRIAHCDGCDGEDELSFDENAANAAHIVKCVNSHDDLLSALESLMWELEDGDNLKRARAAIKKASGHAETCAWMDHPARPCTCGAGE